jgi:hypothetical protein
MQTDTIGEFFMTAVKFIDKKHFLLLQNRLLYAAVLMGTVEDNNIVFRTLSKNGSFNNYPNPCIRNTKIEFTLERDANVSYKLTDATGKSIKNDELGFLGSGQHDIVLDVSSLTAGTYFCSIVIQEKIITREITVLK